MEGEVVIRSLARRSDRAALTTASQLRTIKQSFDLELELCYKLRLGLLRDLNSESGSGFVTARATHAWDDGHVGSWPDPWVCETDKFKT